MLESNRAERVNHFSSADFSQATGTRPPGCSQHRSPDTKISPRVQTAGIERRLVSWLPAPQSPDGLRPVCIQSLFILCTSLSAVMETSWFFSPNSSSWAKRGIYRHGSDGDRREEVVITACLPQIH